MLYEHYTQPLISREKLLKRVLKHIWLTLLIASFALFIGVIGYHELGSLSWIDSLLEASMILGGMGAIAPMTNDAVKLFASFYALFSGLVVLTSTSIMIAPFLHRLLHRLHMEESGSKKSDNK